MGLSMGLTAYVASRKGRRKEKIDGTRVYSKKSYRGKVKPKTREKEENQMVIQG
jgi:hypothetical protein